MVCTYLKWGYLFYLFVNFIRECFCATWGGCLDLLTVITQCEKAHSKYIHGEDIFKFFNILIDYSNYAFSWSTPPKWQSLKRAYFSRINATSNYIKATFGSSWCTVTIRKCSLFSVIPYLNGMPFYIISEPFFKKRKIQVKIKGIRLLE